MVDDETIRNRLRQKSTEELEQMSERADLPSRTLELIADERHRREKHAQHDTQEISNAVVAAATSHSRSPSHMKRAQVKPAWFSWKWLAVAIAVSVMKETSVVRGIVSSLMSTPPQHGGFLSELGSLNRSAKVSGALDIVTAIVWLCFLIDTTMRVVHRLRRY